MGISSFRGPLNWYRTMEKDWKWNWKVAGRKVLLSNRILIKERVTVLIGCAIFFLLRTYFAHRGYYTVARRYEFYVVVKSTILLRSLVRCCTSHENIKFITLSLNV